MKRNSRKRMSVWRIVPLSHPRRRRGFLTLLRWKTWEVHETSQPRISRRANSNIPEPQVTNRSTEPASGSDPIGTCHPIVEEPPTTKLGNMRDDGKWELDCPPIVRRFDGTSEDIICRRKGWTVHLRRFRNPVHEASRVWPLLQ